MDFTSQNLTIPRGKVLFAEFLAGTRMPAGARFVGNCPEFTLSREANNLNHYSSTSGTRTLDASISLGGDLGGTMATDNVDAENMRYWFMGGKRTIAVTAQTAQTYAIPSVSRGGFYQIGRTEANPLGVGNLTTVSIASFEEFRDYEVDYLSGLLYILPGSTIVDESAISVTYGTTAHTYTELSSGERSIEGELRFVSDNPYGLNRRLVIPRVRLAPQGDLSFLTDPESPSWMQLSFGIMAMKKGNLPLVINAEGLPYTGNASGTV